MASVLESYRAELKERKERALKIAEEIRACAKQKSEAKFRMGELFAELHKDELYKLVPPYPRNWTDCCDNIFGYERSYVQRLMQASEYHKHLPALPNGNVWSEWTIRPLYVFTDMSEVEEVGKAVYKWLEGNRWAKINKAVVDICIGWHNDARRAKLSVDTTSEPEVKEEPAVATTEDTVEEPEVVDLETARVDVRLAELDMTKKPLLHPDIVLVAPTLSVVSEETPDVEPVDLLAAVRVTLKQIEELELSAAKHRRKFNRMLRKDQTLRQEIRKGAYILWELVPVEFESDPEVKVHLSPAGDDDSDDVEE